MAGPRGFRYEPEDGQMKGIVAEFAKRGVLETGRQHRRPGHPAGRVLFQATMAVRYGWTEDEALRGMTIEAARP